MIIPDRERAQVQTFEEQFSHVFRMVLPKQHRPKVAGAKKKAPAASAAKKQAAADKLKAKAAAQKKKAAEKKKLALKAAVAKKKVADKKKKAALKAKVAAQAKVLKAKAALKANKAKAVAAVKAAKAKAKTDAKAAKSKAKTDAKAAAKAKKAKAVAPRKMKALPLMKKGAKKVTPYTLTKFGSSGSLKKSSSSTSVGKVQTFTARVADARRAHGMLTREESNTAGNMAQRGAATHKWQFLENNGKFVDYVKKASLEVEKAYASWMVNPHIDVRSVQSGDWEYMVDFNLNEQQNIRHKDHRIRKIQRVAV